MALVRPRSRILCASNCVTKALFRAHLVVLGFVVCLASQTADSKGAYATNGESGHYDDWFSTLGVYDSSSKRSLQPLLTLLQTQVIDAEANNSNPTPLRKKLQEDWKLTFGPKNHRVLFHWGFNQDIKRYKPLLKEIDDQFKANLKFFEEKFRKEGKQGGLNDYLDEQRSAVLECINEERARRNRLIITETATRTGLSGGQPSRGFATILWDIHVLGDYTTPATNGLLDAKGLRRDLISAGLERMDFERSDIKSLCDALYEAEQNEPKIAAAKMMVALGQYLPSLLTKRWGNTLGKQGIVITANQ